MIVRSTLGFLVSAALVIMAGCGGPNHQTALESPSLRIEPAATAATSSEAATAASQDSSAAASAEIGAPEATNALQPGQGAEAALPVIPLHSFQPAGGRQRVVVLDPGHGGPEVGAAGAGVAEKDVNLRIALRLKELLEQDGFVVVLTRDGDHRAIPPPGYESGPGARETRVDLQARIDIANRAGADVFISIHNNGSSDPSESGTEVWWDGRRPFAAFNRVLAEEMLSSLVGAIRGSGYPTINRGLKEDSEFRLFQGRAFPIFVLGPPRIGGMGSSRGTLMPAVLGETLFLSNPAEAPQLTRDSMIATIARGYHDGLLRYFAHIDDGSLSLPADGLPPETPNRFDPPMTR